MFNDVFVEYDAGDGEPVVCRLLSFVVRSDDKTYAVISDSHGNVGTVAESEIKLINVSNS